MPEYGRGSAQLLGQMFQARGRTQMLGQQMQQQQETQGFNRWAKQVELIVSMGQNIDQNNPQFPQLQQAFQDLMNVGAQKGWTQQAMGDVPLAGRKPEMGTVYGEEGKIGRWGERRPGVRTTAAKAPKEISTLEGLLVKSLQERDASEADITAVKQRLLKPAAKTALQKNVPFLAKTMEIREAEAARILTESKDKSEEQLWSDMYKSAINAYRSEDEARQIADSFLEMRRAVFGEEADTGTMPPPGQHKGATVRDTVTGKRFKSDGTKWVEIR